MANFQHDAASVHCDPELSSQLKFAAGSAIKKMPGLIQGDVPVLMSGAGHDALAMSHLTKVLQSFPSLVLMRFSDSSACWVRHIVGALDH